MFNKSFKAQIAATTPFWFHEGEDQRHGVSIKAEIETDSAEFLRDCVGDYSAVADLFTSTTLVDGDVALKIVARNDLQFSIAEMRPRSVKLTELSIRPGTRITIKLKVSDIPKDIMGDICSQLGVETDITISTTQMDLPLAENEGKKGKKTK